MDRRDIRFDFKGNQHHYLLDVQLDRHLVRAIFDTGASFSCVSLGLARLLGWEVVADVDGTVSGVEGVAKSLAGRLVEPVLRFSESFEVTLSHLIVLPTEAPLFLLGNDLFNSHSSFTFLGLRAATPRPQLEFWDSQRAQLIVLTCLHKPAGGTGGTGG